MWKQTQRSPEEEIDLREGRKTKKKNKDMPPMPTVSRNLCFFFGVFLFFVYLDLCGLFWHIWAYCGLLWPFDDVKTLQEENTAKHCKENSAKRTGAQRPFLLGYV